MRQGDAQGTLIYFPQLSKVETLLDMDHPFVTKVRDNMLSGIINNKNFQKYRDQPEFVIFDDENIDMLQIVFDLYFVPNIGRAISNSIWKNLFQGKHAAAMVEKEDVELFDKRDTPSSNEIRYISDEAALMLLDIIPSLKSTARLPKDSLRIGLLKDEIFVLGSANQLDPLYLDKTILRNTEVTQLLFHVTGSKSKDYTHAKTPPMEGNEKSEFVISTYPTNCCRIIKFPEVKNPNE
jgi:hypothetical protein